MTNNKDPFKSFMPTDELVLAQRLKEIEANAKYHAMEASEKAEKRETTCRYASAILMSQVKNNPRQPLSLEQIEHAAITAEIARRRIASKVGMDASEFLRQASCLPNSRLRQERLENKLEAATIETSAPRF